MIDKLRAIYEQVHGKEKATIFDNVTAETHLTSACWNAAGTPYSVNSYLPEYSDSEHLDAIVRDIALKTRTPAKKLLQDTAAWCAAWALKRFLTVRKCTMDGPNRLKYAHQNAADAFRLMAAAEQQ